MNSIRNQKKLLITISFLAVIILLSGCSNTEIVTSCLKGHTFGFWGGLLHGFIAPFDLILMLFRDDIAVFAPNNNGIWYSFGFLIGSGGWGFFGGNRASKSRN